MTSNFDPTTARLLQPASSDTNAPSQQPAFDPSTARLAAQPVAAPSPAAPPAPGTFDASTAQPLRAKSGSGSGTFDPSTARRVAPASPIDVFDQQYSPTRASARNDPPQTSVLGDVGRGIAQAGLGTARTLGLAGAGALEAVTLGHAPESITNPIFHAVDAIKDYQDTIQRPTTTVGRIAEAAGGLVGALPTLGVGNLSEGQDILREGGSLGHALGQTALNAAGDVAGLGIGKVAEKAGTATRALSQGAANTAFGEASRVAGNAIAPEDRQREFDPLDAAINFGAGVGFGLLPHGRDPAANDVARAAGQGGAETAPPPFDIPTADANPSDAAPLPAGRWGAETAPRADAFPGSATDAQGGVAKGVSGAADMAIADRGDLAQLAPSQIVDPVTGATSPIPDPASGSIARAVAKGVETGAVQTTQDTAPASWSDANAAEVSTRGSLTKPDIASERPDPYSSAGTSEEAQPSGLAESHAADTWAGSNSAADEVYPLQMEGGNPANKTGRGDENPLAAGEEAAPAPEQGKVDRAARDSAAHPDTEIPVSVAQHEAGNFRMGHVNLHGLDVTIEVPKGGLRRGVAQDGTAWERAASDHYGYIKRTESADGEPFDVYLGPHAEDANAKVFVIDQVRPGTRTYDESKAMIGFANGRAARASYDANFPKGLKTFGGIREMSMDEFKRWVKRDATQPAADVSSSPGPAATDPAHAALAAIAAGEHPAAVLGDAHGDTVRAVAAAMGRKYSPKAPAEAIVARLGEVAHADRVRAAQAAVNRVGPARELPGSLPPRVSIELIPLGSARELPGTMAPAAKDTPAFKHFFGDSKVVDPNGEPLVVHHGTGEDFTVFDHAKAGAATEHATSPLGHFFTEDRAQAKRYAENASDGRPADERVIDAYLSIRKPYAMTLKQAQAIETPAQARALREKLERAGHDGIRIAEAKTWIAFESGQAKSVDNRGTFDRANPDINYSRDGRPIVDGRPGLGEQEVRRIAKGVLGIAGDTDQGVVPLRVVGTAKELPQAVRDHMEANGIAPEEIRGVHWKGTSYLVADRLPARRAVEETIFHEHYAHGGLRAKYGNRLGGVMAKLAERVGGLDGIRQLAREQGIDLSHYEATTLDNPRIPARFQVPYLMEELMAHLSESTGTLRRIIQEYVGAVRAWLRANRFAELADYGVTDLAHVLRQARETVATKAVSGKDAPLYHREWPAADGSRTTDDPRFQRRRADDAGGASAAAEHLGDDQREALGKIGTFARGEGLPEKWKRLTERWREKLEQGLVDQFAPLRKLDKDAYMQARLSRGTDGALEAMFAHGTPKLTDGALDVTVDGKGLRGLLSDLGGEHDLFLAWMAGHRADALSKEWEVHFGDGATKRYRSETEARAAAAAAPGAKASAASREHLFSPEDIAALKRLDQGVMPDGASRSEVYAKTQREFRRYQKAVLDIAEQAGLIDADSRATWESDFYVPFYRQAESDPAAFTPAKVGSGLVRQKAFEQLRGGTDRLNDLLGNTLANWSHLLAASMRNMAASKAIAAAERMGIAERIGSAEKGSVWISQKGRQVHYRVSDPLVVDALTMLNASGLNTPAVRAMSAMKRALSFGVTINPSFRIRNLLRDTLSAMAISDVGYNPLRNIVEGWRATGAESETFHKLLASGGAIRFGSLNDGEQAAHAKRLVRLGVKDAQILDSKTKIKNALSHAWEWWKDIGDRTETVNRAVIYERAVARGASHLEASYEARDLLDFTMGGKWAAMRFLVQTVPFLNARAQGLFKLARGAQANPLRFASVTGAIAMASAVLYLLQKDDPEYRGLPDWARDSYWCVKLGDKMLFLPKPFEIGALGSVVERGTELATAGPDYQARDFARSALGILVDQLSMNPIPQAVRPMTEAFFNYDTYRGRPIDSEGQDRLPPSDRYTAHTSAAAIGAGQALSVSPQKIEHLVRGYFGWLGLQALNVTDLIARPLTDLPTNPNRDLYSVSNWPGAGDFVKPAAGLSSKYVDRFYANQQKTEQIYAAYSMARNAGDLDRARELAGSDAVRLRKLGNAMNRRMQEVNQRIRRTTSDRSLGATEKRMLLEGLTTQRNRIAERADEMRRASPR